MTNSLQVAVLYSVACLFSAFTSQPAENQFVRQTIPIDIQKGKTVTVEISSLSGNGENHVGIRCPAEIWDAITNSTNKVTVRLKSSDKKGTVIGGISPGSGKRWPIDSFHYLFYIYGEYEAKASVEITFPNAPPGITHGQIIVCKTPADTGL